MDVMTSNLTPLTRTASAKVVEARDDTRDMEPTDVENANHELQRAIVIHELHAQNNKVRDLHRSSRLAPHPPDPPTPSPTSPSHPQSAFQPQPRLCGTQATSRAPLPPVDTEKKKQFGWEG